MKLNLLFVCLFLVTQCRNKGSLTKARVTLIIHWQEKRLQSKLMIVLSRSINLRLSSFSTTSYPRSNHKKN